MTKHDVAPAVVFREIDEWMCHVRRVFAVTPQSRTAYCGSHVSKAFTQQYPLGAIFGVTDIVVESGAFLEGVRELVTKWRRLQSHDNTNNLFSALSRQWLQSGVDTYLLWSESACMWVILLTDKVGGVTYRCDGVSLERLQYSPMVTIAQIVTVSAYSMFGKPVDNVTLCMRWTPHATVKHRSDHEVITLTYRPQYGDAQMSVRSSEHHLPMRIDTTDKIYQLTALGDAIADQLNAVYDAFMTHVDAQLSPPLLDRVHVTIDRYI